MAGMVACAMLFCLACGELDLSVGSVVACAGVVAAVCINLTESVILTVPLLTESALADPGSRLESHDQMQSVR